jgi:hypothetical protein
MLGLLKSLFSMSARAFLVPSIHSSENISDRGAWPQLFSAFGRECGNHDAIDFMKFAYEQLSLLPISPAVPEGAIEFNRIVLHCFVVILSYRGGSIMDFKFCCKPVCGDGQGTCAGIECPTSDK